MIANQLDGIFEYSHHAEAKQVDLDDAHVGAVVLVPLDDGSAGHCGRLERHDRIELALADDHSSRVLPQMAWQILQSQTQVEKLSYPKVAYVESSAVKLRLQRIR